MLKTSINYNYRPITEILANAHIFQLYNFKCPERVWVINKIIHYYLNWLINYSIKNLILKQDINEEAIKITIFLNNKS